MLDIQMRYPTFQDSLTLTTFSADLPWFFVNFAYPRTGYSTQPGSAPWLRRISTLLDTCQCTEDWFQPPANTNYGKPRVISNTRKTNWGKREDVQRGYWEWFPLFPGGYDPLFPFPQKNLIEFRERYLNIDLHVSWFGVGTSSTCLSRQISRLFVNIPN